MRKVMRRIGGRMKNRFVTGVISGVLCTLIICSLSFGVLYRNALAQKDNGNKNESVQSTDNGTKTEETTAIDEATFQKKLKYIKNLVDNYYLWDVNEGNYQTGMLKGMMSALNDPYSTIRKKNTMPLWKLPMAFIMVSVLLLARM